MKTIIFAGVVALAMASQAQGTAPTAAPAAQPTATAKAPAKKAVKAKKATAKPKAAVTPAAPAAVAAAPAAATETVAAPAAGTSTAEATAVAAPSKKWGAKVVLDMWTDNEGAKDISKATVNSINYLGASYKLDAGSVGLRQYFSYDSIPGQDTAVKQDFTVLTFGTKLSGIMGSDEIAPLFWYYLPTSVAMKKNFGTKLSGDQIDSMGLLRMDASIDWTLSPKWSVGYYLNPRQSLHATQTVINPAGAEALLEAQTRLVHWLSASYTVNDNIKGYFYGGFDNRMATERLTSVRDDYTSGLGAEFSMLGGKVIINPEINITTPLKVGGEYVSAPRWYQSEDFTYELVTVVAF